MPRLRFGDRETLPDGVERHFMVHRNIGRAVLVETETQ